MSSAKAINLRVRPLQSVDLSFPVDGILGKQTDIHLLGKPVKAYDPGNLYASLGDVLSPVVQVLSPTGPKVPVSKTLPASDQPLGWGRLKYDSSAIRSEMSASILFELRAEHVKAALDKAIGLRENIWVQKYERSVYEATQKAYDRDGPLSKLNRLKKLADISKLQHDRLDQEYADFKSTGVGFHNGVIKASITNTSVSSHKMRTMPQSGGSVQDWTTDAPVINQVNSAYGQGYEYRHPSLENAAQYQRAQISLLEEQLSAESITNYVCGSQVENDAGIPQLATFFTRYLANDLNAIDLDIKRLQVAYMDTLLVSPINGVVTGVFRNLGDSVRAAQSVVRVENDAEIYLVGTLKYPGLLQIDQSITVSTNLFDSSVTKSVTGTVKAVRGHDSQDDLWDLLILCGNRDSGGHPRFPINYNFDFNSTVVNVA
jgi:hypothetical protein